MVEQKPLSDELICPRCHTGNPSDGVFCFACGTKIGPGMSSEGNEVPTTKAIQGEGKDEERYKEVQVEPLIKTGVKRRRSATRRKQR